MLCSKCMTQLIERDDTVICPNCNSIHGAEPIPEYQSDFDANIEKPDGIGTRVFRGAVWVSGVVGLVLLGGVGGWTLRGSVPDPSNASLVRVASSAFEQAEEPSDTITFDPKKIEPKRVLILPATAHSGRHVVASNDSGELFQVSLGGGGGSESARRLVGAEPGYLASSAMSSAGAVVAALQSDDQWVLQSWDKDGAPGWTKTFDADSEADAQIALHALADGIVAIFTDPETAQLGAHFLDEDGALAWHVGLGQTADAYLSVHASPFDEVIVLMRDEADSEVLHVRSWTPAGVPGLSTELSVSATEGILATTVDSLGQVHVLLSGAPPRLLTQDALGRSSKANTLDALHAIARDTDCLTDSRSDHLRVACLNNGSLRDNVFDLRPVVPAAVSQSVIPLDPANRLLTISDNIMIAFAMSEGTVFDPFSIRLRPIPELGFVAIPDDGVANMP
ncbi:MAG: hypothetical protein AAGJ84_09125 [Pseudomonadota bacterium]